MELPEDIFKELAAGAPYDRSSQAAHQRQSPRAQLAVDVVLLRLGEGRHAKAEPARLLDLSSRGAGLEAREPIHVGEPFAIRLMRRDRSSLWIQCIGVRWSVLDKNRCSVGAAFTRLLTPAAAPENHTLPVAVAAAAAA